MIKKEKIRFCQTCSVQQGKLVELNLLESIIHRLKGHWVRKGYIGVTAKSFTVLPKPIITRRKECKPVEKWRDAPQVHAKLKYKPRTAYEKRLWKNKEKDEDKK